MAYLRCLQSIKAISKDEESGSKRVKPVDLDIYFEPKGTIAQSAPEEKPYALQEYVSVVRKKLWGFKDVTLDAYTSTETAVVGVKDGLVDVYESAKSDPLSMVRPGCITAAVIVGAAVQGRGRKPFLRLTSASVAGALVASVAYPDKAFKTAKNVYTITRDATVSLAEKIRKISEQAQGPQKTEVAITSLADKYEGSSDNSSDDESGAFPEIIKVDHSAVKAEVVEPSEMVVTIIKDDKGEDICLINNSAIVMNVDVDTAVKVEGKAEVVTEKAKELLVENVEVSQVPSPDAFVSNEQEKKPEITNDAASDQNEIPSEEIVKAESQTEQQVKEEIVVVADSEESFSQGNELEVKDNEPQVDFGQSNPEDQDMYSTRS